MQTKVRRCWIQIKEKKIKLDSFDRALIAKTSLNVAITIVCVLSVERYFAICHPFLASKRQLSSLSHAMKAIPVMWSIGVLGALPLALQYGLVHHVDEPTMIGCRKINKIITYLEGIRSLLIFAVPMLIICTMYTLIGLRLKRSSKTIRNHNDPTDRTKQRAPKMLGEKIFVIKSFLKDIFPKICNKEIIILVVVVAAFIVCQMPIHVIRMFRIHNSLYKSLTKMFDKTTWFFVTDVSHIMYYLSSLINPILYNTMSRKFRIAFKVWTKLLLLICLFFCSFLPLWKQKTTVV